jgi:hypothetical protein
MISSFIWLFFFHKFLFFSSTCALLQFLFIPFIFLWFFSISFPNYFILLACFFFDSLCFISYFHFLPYYFFLAVFLSSCLCLLLSSFFLRLLRKFLHPSPFVSSSFLLLSFFISSFISNLRILNNIRWSVCTNETTQRPPQRRIFVKFHFFGVGGGGCWNLYKNLSTFPDFCLKLWHKWQTVYAEYCF